MTITQAKSEAVRRWGQNADAWASPCGSLCFVKADVRPSQVPNLSVPMGWGQTFTQAFKRSER